MNAERPPLHPVPDGRAPRLLKMTSRPIRSEELLAAVAASGYGAQALFLGVVRDVNEGRKVSAVSYDAFRPLAENVLLEIAREALARWPAAVAVLHRVGRLRVGQAGLGVAAASPHRAEAFEACRYVVEQIKRRLPVWKLEHRVDGSSVWVEGRALPRPD